MTATADVTLASLLFEHPLGDHEGLLHTVDRTLRAGQAREQAAAVAADLRAQGVEEGQAVAVRLPNGPEVITAMAGIWSIGAVFVPVNARLPEAELQTVLGPADPAAVITTAGIERASGTRRYEVGTAFILWTSGTTGRPKPILHTHRGYLELLDRVLVPLRAAGRDSGRAGGASGAPAAPRPPSPNLIPVSLALNAGIYNALFGLRAGAPLVIMDRFSTAELAELVRRFGIRSTVLPPAAIAMLNDDPDVESLEPLRYVRSITAPLSPVAARRFTERFGVFVLNSYGQAEVGEVIGWTAADARAHPEKVGAAGRPLPGVAVRIVDDGDRPVEVGRSGRLLVRPPSMAAGYASGAELADRMDAEGYLDTGDHARMDAEGFVWIEGRSSDLINRGGNKVFPDEVEEVLRLHPDVTDAAVAAEPDERLGEVPVAFVVTVTEPDPAALEALCRAHLTPYKVPVAFVRVPDLPRSDVGKVLRRALVAQHLGEAAASSAPRTQAR